jgi:hypothetical protein
MEIIERTNKINFITDATLLTSIMKCGRFTDLNMNKSLQSVNGKSNSLEAGSIIHKYLEVYYKSSTTGISKDQAHGFGKTAAELYIQGCALCTNFIPYHTHTNLDEHCTEDCIRKPKCGHQINEYPGVTNTPAESDGYIIGWKYVLDTCDQYFEHYKSDFWVTLETEIVKSKILYEDDDIRILFKSKLDWIVDTNTGIYPCDHKTMKQNRDSVSLNNQFMGQCLIMDTRNVYINKIGFQKTLKPVDKFKRITVSYTAARLYEWQSQILPYWCKTAVMYNEQGYYPPNFSNCDGKFGFCTYKEVCESNPDMRSDVLKLNFIKTEQWNPTNADE